MTTLSLRTLCAGALLGGAVLFFAGCSATAMHERGLGEYAPGVPERRLLQGIQAYEDGQLKTAATHLGEALSGGLVFDRDKVTAYKYLAFIDCSSGREQRCRDDFIAALAIDPDLQLTAAEAGHPVWGPIFKSVKARSRQ